MPHCFLQTPHSLKSLQQCLFNLTFEMWSWYLESFAKVFKAQVLLLIQYPMLLNIPVGKVFTLKCLLVYKLSQ